MKKFKLNLLTSMFILASVKAVAIDVNEKLEFGVKDHREQILFNLGDDNAMSWRIPSLLNTQNGTLIAAIDKHWQNNADWGDNDTVIRISKDQGKTWDSIKTIINLPTQNEEGRSPPLAIDKRWGYWNKGNYINSAFLIDPLMLQDKRNNRVFLAIDMFPESQGFFSTNNVQGNGNGHILINGKNYLRLNTTNNDVWTLRENGEVYNNENVKTEYRVITQGNPDIAFNDLGDIYKGDEKLGNIYLKIYGKNAKAPFTVNQTGYFWITHSDDEGNTWSSPTDITSQVKKDWMRFFGTGPGTGIQTKNGNLIFPIYYTNQNGAQSSALIISSDGGKSWSLGESPNDSRSELRERGLNSQSMGKNLGRTNVEITESQVVELGNGDLKLFMRNASGKVLMATSKTGGFSWLPNVETITQLNNPHSQLSIIKYSKKIDGKEYLIFSGPSESGGGANGRRNGKLFLGEVNENGSIEWTEKRMKPIHSTGKGGQHPNGYVYSSLAELNDGNIGLLYENTTDHTSVAYLPVELQELFYRDGKIFSDVRQEPLIFSYNGRENLTKIGDGIAIKQGQGKSLSSINVNEGTLIIDQQEKDGQNKAFENVILNNSGMLVVKGKQYIDELSITDGAKGNISFFISDDDSSTLFVNNQINGDINVNVISDKKLRLEKGIKLLSVLNNTDTKFKLVDGELPKGMYFYTLSKVRNQSVLRTTNIPYSVYFTNQLIDSDGNDVTSSSSNNARPRVNPVLASYLVSNLAITQNIDKVHNNFLVETNNSLRNGKNIFVKYLHGSEKYHSNLGFTNYGYNFKTDFNGVMLGGKLWESLDNSKAFYISGNKTSYNVTPYAVDGESKGKYQSWGISTNYRYDIEKWSTNFSATYQLHKGNIANAKQIKGKSLHLGLDVGYSLPLDNFDLMPFAGIHYLRSSISNIFDQYNQAKIEYDTLNAIKSSIGFDIGYRTEKMGIKGNVSYDFYYQNGNQLFVDNIAYKQGKLENKLNIGTQLSFYLTPKLSLSANLGIQQARKTAYNASAGINYQF